VHIVRTVGWKRVHADMCDTYKTHNLVSAKKIEQMYTNPKRWKSSRANEHYSQETFDTAVLKNVRQHQRRCSQEILVKYFSQETLVISHYCLRRRVILRYFERDKLTSTQMHPPVTHACKTMYAMCVYQCMYVVKF
jgi:hypothetical protein